jgi:hypothetical protein
VDIFTTEKLYNNIVFKKLHETHPMGQKSTGGVVHGCP